MFSRLLPSLTLLLGFGSALMLAGPARAVIVLTVEQDGADVLITGSGSAKTNALSEVSTSTTWNNVFTELQLYAGPATNDDGQVRTWGGASGGPLLIGSSSVTALPEPSSSGDLFGIVSDAGAAAPWIVLPLSYSSGNNLSGSSRFANYTLADLGLSPGVLTWTWGSGPDADSLEIRINGDPVPAPLPLAGGALAWKFSRRMRRLSQRQKRLSA